MNKIRKMQDIFIVTDMLSLGKESNGSPWSIRCEVVYNKQYPSDFEIKWMKMLEKYELFDNE